MPKMAFLYFFVKLLYYTIFNKFSEFYLTLSQPNEI